MAVSDEYESIRYPSGFYFVTSAETRQAGGRDDFFIFHFRKDGLDDHLFGASGVETFGDYIGVGENFGDVGFVEPEAKTIYSHGWIYPPQILDGRGDFGLAELVGEIVLAVKIGLFDIIAIGDDESACAGARESGDDGRTQTSQARDADDGVSQFFFYLDHNTLKIKSTPAKGVPWFLSASLRGY